VSGAAFRALAVDSTDLLGPSEVRHRAFRVPAGGRVDLGLTMPQGGSAVLVQLGAGGSPALVVGPASAAVPAAAAAEEVIDLLTYGTPAPLGFDADQPDRRFTYTIGRRPGSVDGVPGLFWTINGRLFPDVPMFVVAEGEVVRMTLTNNSGQLHPMHLHGHHVVVLARDGIPSTGSPWWVDSLDVADGQTFDIAFLADNPGVWMDHCHNLVHAREGLVAHLMYEGVTTPYLVGGPAGNTPE
jgi:FtsP/CotA-like multicopper oxidase with cupredoxin domain